MWDYLAEIAPLIKPTEYPDRPRYTLRERAVHGFFMAVILGTYGWLLFRLGKLVLNLF